MTLRGDTDGDDPVLDKSRGWSEPIFGGSGFGGSASSSDADKEHIDFESDLGDVGDDRRFEDVLWLKSSLMMPLPYHFYRNDEGKHRTARHSRLGAPKT